MSETLTLPVLPVDDEVVLPGMVVPLETSKPEVGAAIDAARMPSRQVPGMRSETKARVLLLPRLADRRRAGAGTLAVVDAAWSRARGSRHSRRGRAGRAAARRAARRRGARHRQGQDRFGYPRPRRGAVGR